MAGNYKNFLRLLEKWPIDVTKKKRDIGVFIREQVKLNFTSGGINSTIDQEKCDRAFYSLKRLVDNHYKKLYHRSSFSSATGLNAEQCKTVLSDEFLDNLAEQRKKIIINILDKPLPIKKVNK
ncbi:ubiquinol-cytochrome-c reductase complex assembly factor 2 [Lycorma delicatula]|uniref:ubiquinol-cytochrome-c reductase complex assembly factor 2 n=1 Tax=Lycorma delicatula TaxID=130591 RepID=UPI003F51803D